MRAIAYLPKPPVLGRRHLLILKPARVIVREGGAFASSSGKNVSLLNRLKRNSIEVRRVIRFARLPSIETERGSIPCWDIVSRKNQLLIYELRLPIVF